MQKSHPLNRWLAARFYYISKIFSESHQQTWFTLSMKQEQRADEPKVDNYN